MKRYVSTWAPVCALIGISLALISCAKSNSAESGLPSPSSALAGITTDYSAVVMVVLPGGSGICTGTRISKHAVLTASHCVKSTGRYSITESGHTFSTYTVKAFGPGVVADPNDIALLIFDAEIATDDQIYGIGASVHSGDTLRLVGYGCNNLSTKTGAGTKRTGTNVVESVDDYVEFSTPATATGILGASNRSGSCFGDSGGPAINESADVKTVVGVTHAGGYEGSNIISQYCDLTRSDNRGWLSTQNTTYNLAIKGL